MEKAIKELRNKMANQIYDADYDDLLMLHKDAVNNVLKYRLNQIIDQYAYATIL